MTHPANIDDLRNALAEVRQRQWKKHGEKLTLLDEIQRIQEELKRLEDEEVKILLAFSSTLSGIPSVRDADTSGIRSLLPATPASAENSGIQSLLPATPQRAVPTGLKSFFVVRTGTKKDAILSAAKELIQQFGAVSTEELLQELQTRSVDVRGEDHKTQIKNLSSYLSRAKDGLGIEPSSKGWKFTSSKGEAPSDAGGNLQAEGFNVQPVPAMGHNT